MLEPVQHWLAVHAGIGPTLRALYWYSWWSGAASDIGEITLIAGVIGAFRAINCHEPRCWRIGKHPIVGGRFKVCKRHHPDIPTHMAQGHIAKAHREHQAALVPKPPAAKPRKVAAKKSG